MAQQVHTHWKKLNNPEYLGAYAFEPGEEKTATISVVQQEMVTGPDGKKEQCLVAHFQETDLKPMILNATNCKTISNFLKTPYIEDWAGKKISMHVEQVRAFGDLVDAVRVMKKLSVKSSQTAPAALRCAACGKEITGLAGYTAEQIAATNKQRYGKCLCVECGKKRKEELDAAKAAQSTAVAEPDEGEGNDVSAELLAGMK